MRVPSLLNKSTLVDVNFISCKHFLSGGNVLKKMFSPICKIYLVNSLHTGASLPTCAYILKAQLKKLC